MYLVYLGDVQLPVAPAKIERKVKNLNKTYNLINESEIAIPKQPGLSEITFTCLLPVRRYPFAIYPNNVFQKPSHYSSHLARLKIEKRAFDFRILRYLSTSGNSSADMDFLLRVLLEDYTVVEDTRNAPDIEVNIKLREYRDYGTKLITIKKGDGSMVISEEVQRPSDKTPQQSYIVKTGDTFWSIAQRELGSGDRWQEIIELNKKDALKTKGSGRAENGGYDLTPGITLRLPAS